MFLFHGSRSTLPCHHVFSAILLNLIISLSSSSLFVSSTEVSLCLSVGSSAQLECVSSFAPPWSKIGPRVGDYKIIGVNGKKHPKWDEPRFSFTNEDSVYKIQIEDVRLKDAGKYVCEGDTATSYVLSVIRYLKQRIDVTHLTDKTQ